MGRRALVASIAMLLAAACSSGADDSNRVAAGANAEFPAGGPGPAEEAKDLSGPLAADQRRCIGLGPRSAAAGLTVLAHPFGRGRAPEVRDEGGRCLLRLVADHSRFEHTWSPSGRQLLLRTATGWLRIGDELDAAAVAEHDVPPVASSFAAAPGRPVAQVPNGASLEVEEAGDEVLLWAHHDGRSGRLAVGRASHGATVVGSPWDPTALAWSFVPDGTNAGCGTAEGRVTRATRDGKVVDVEGTPVEGLWPVLWLPDGALVLSELPAGCGPSPAGVWVLRDGEAAQVAEAAIDVAVRPGAG